MSEPSTRYHFIMVTARGYTHVSTFRATSLQAACAAHIKAWHSRASSCAVIMRAPSGKRYSYNDSLGVVNG